MIPLESLRDRGTWFLRYRSLGRWPPLWRTLNAVRPSPPPHRLKSDTELILEGFPRCANSFAVLAFQELQPGSVRLAHHTHVAATVREGTHRGIPTVVLIRRPREAVSSVLVRRPALTAEEALGAYRRYYADVAACGPLVLADFAVVTRQFHRVVREVNRLFGTGFAARPLDPTRRQNVMDWIDELDAESARERFRTLSKPHPRRSRHKRTIQKRLRGLDELQRASALYERLGGSVKPWEGEVP